MDGGERSVICGRRPAKSDTRNEVVLVRLRGIRRHVEVEECGEGEDHAEERNAVLLSNMAMIGEAVTFQQGSH